MYKSIFTTLTLAASALAVALPSCSTAKVTLNLPAAQTALAQQTGPPSFALLGVGVQNYTCSAEGKYVSAGAVAELYDISCLAGTPVYAGLQNIAYTIWKALPDKVITPNARNRITSGFPLKISSSGSHFFSTTAAGSIAPVWDMRATGPKNVQGKSVAYVVGAKVAGIPAPTGSKDVDWLQIKGVEGSLATMVYRTDTVGGPAPASCAAGSAPISVKYTSKYLLYGSTVA